MSSSFGGSHDLQSPSSVYHVSQNTQVICTPNLKLTVLFVRFGSGAFVLLSPIKETDLRYSTKTLIFRSLKSKSIPGESK